MGSSYDNVVLDFDLNFLQQNGNNALGPAQNKEQLDQKTISNLKKKILAVNILLKKYNAQRLLSEHTQKLLIASTEECKQYCIKYKDASQKNETLEKNLQELHEKNRQLEAKCITAENRYSGAQSFINQLQILLKQRDAIIESIKASNAPTERVNVKKEKRLSLLIKEKDYLIRSLSSIAEVVFNKRKITKKDKNFLKKYSSVTSEEFCGQLSDEENSGSDLDMCAGDLEQTQKEQNSEKITKASVNLKEPPLECDKNHDEIRNRAVSVDTGRGSSLDFSDSDKCFHSPDYYISDSPHSIDNDRNKIQHVDSATSPITIREFVEVALSPIRFEHTSGVDSAANNENNCSSIFDVPTEISTNDTTIPPALENNSPLSFGYISIASESLSAAATEKDGKFNKTAQEIQCLESNSSENISDIDRNDKEIEMILQSMRLSHKPVTPIPPTPAKSLSKTKTLSVENEGPTNLVPEFTKMKKKHKMLFKNVALLTKEVFNIKDLLMKCKLGVTETETSNLNDETSFSSNTHSMIENNDDTTNENISVPTILEKEVEDNLNSTVPMDATNLELENENNNHTNKVDELDINSSGDTNENRNKKATKAKKISNLEKLRKKLEPKSKIKAILSPPTLKHKNKANNGNITSDSKLRKRLNDISCMDQAKAECITSLCNKDAYDKAVKVMKEIKAKQNIVDTPDGISKTDTNSCKKDTNTESPCSKEKQKPARSVTTKEIIKENSASKITTNRYRTRSTRKSCEENIDSCPNNAKEKQKSSKNEKSPSKILKENSTSNSRSSCEENNSIKSNDPDGKLLSKNGKHENSPTNSTRYWTRSTRSSCEENNNSNSMNFDEVELSANNSEINKEKVSSSPNKNITRKTLNSCEGLSKKDEENTVHLNTKADIPGKPLDESKEVNLSIPHGPTSINTNKDRWPSFSSDNAVVSITPMEYDNKIVAHTNKNKANENEPESTALSSRVLRSSTRQNTSKSDTGNNAKSQTLVTTGSVKLNTSDNVTSHGKLINYNDLDLFSEPSPKKQKKSLEPIPVKSGPQSPHQSVLCKMIDKYGITFIRTTPKKIPESTVDSTCKVIEDGILHVIGVPATESKRSMDTLVEEIQSWKFKEFLAGLMKYLMDPARKLELFNKVVTPPAPSMTKSEQVLLYILTRLNKCWPDTDLIDAVLNQIEYSLFRLNQTPEFDVIESMSHFYAVLCRYIKARSRLRLFVLDAMYCIQFKAVLVVRQCLDVSMHILPLAHMGTAKSPLVTCLVYLLHFYKCEDRYNRVQEIRNILSKKYFYQITEWNESKMLDLIWNAIEEAKVSVLQRKMLRLALIIMAKRQGPRWCHNKLIAGIILPIIAKENVPETTKAFCVSMIGPLLKPYPMDMKIHCEILTNQLIDMLQHSTTRLMQEAVVSSLICLSKHNQTRIIQALLLWRPKKLFPESEIIIRDYVKEKPLKVWKHLLSKIALG